MQCVECGLQFWGLSGKSICDQCEYDEKEIIKVREHNSRINRWVKKARKL